MYYPCESCGGLAGDYCQTTDANGNTLYIPLCAKCATRIGIICWPVSSLASPITQTNNGSLPAHMVFDAAEVARQKQLYQLLGHAAWSAAFTMAVPSLNVPQPVQYIPIAKIKAKVAATQAQAVLPEDIKKKLRREQAMANGETIEVYLRPEELDLLRKCISVASGFSRSMMDMPTLPKDDGYKIKCQTHQDAMDKLSLKLERIK